MLEVSNDNKLLKLRNIEKSFGKIYILKNLDLDIIQSEILVIIGKSGCGKSTLLRILLGLYPPEKGLLYYKDKNLIDFKIVRNLVGFVSQENSFYEKLNVEENLKFYAKMYSVEKHEIEHRINYLLDIVQLSYYRKKLSFNLSGGMKRRLEFAISLIHNPKILILDEPFTGLDISIRDEIWETINEIKKAGVTVLITTHLLTTSAKHADRIAILHDKKIKKIIYEPNPETIENIFIEETKR